MSAAAAPHFRHDCPHCHFLGGYAGGHRYADLYVCAGGGEVSAVADACTTFVARFSDEPADCSSGEWLAYGRSAPLTEARRRAQSRGLYVYRLVVAARFLVPNDSRDLIELRQHAEGSLLAGLVEAALARDAEAFQCRAGALTAALRSHLQQAGLPVPPEPSLRAWVVEDARWLLSHLWPHAAEPFDAICRRWLTAA